MRAVVARYVKGATLRVSARVARSRRALGAGSRAECRYTVMQRAATVARTGKIEREGRGTARAPASIPRRRTTPAPRPRARHPVPPSHDHHHPQLTLHRRHQSFLDVTQILATELSTPPDAADGHHYSDLYKEKYFVNCINI